MADKCELAASYAIGLAEALSISIDTFGTEKESIEDIHKFVAKNFNFTSTNIIKELGLDKPIYKNTACYGHFGREEFSWDKIKKLNSDSQMFDFC